MEIDASELGPGPSRVYPGGNSTLRSRLFRGRPHLFKEYHQTFAQSVDLQALRGLAAWRDGLDPAARQRLDSVAAWPHHLVFAGGVLAGVLILEAPNAFLLTSGRNARPRTFSDLIPFEAGGEPRPGLPLAARKRAIGHAIEILLWLHELGVAVVDVQTENILSTQDGQRVFFVDCDVAWGPWGRPSPPAAPDVMHSAIPTVNSPSATSDLARMAWVTVWLLTDGGIGRSTGAEAAGVMTFLRERSVAHFTDARSLERWRQLAESWITIAGPLRRAQHVPTEPGWVPRQFRMPELLYRVPPSEQNGPAASADFVPPGTGRWPVLVLGFVCAVVLASLILFEAYREGIL